MGFSISNAFKVPPEGFRASWCWFKGGELEALRGVVVVLLRAARKQQTIYKRSSCSTQSLIGEHVGMKLDNNCNAGSDMDMAQHSQRT